MPERGCVLSVAERRHISISRHRCRVRSDSGLEAPWNLSRVTQELLKYLGNQPRRSGQPATSDPGMTVVPYNIRARRGGECACRPVTHR
jgi:hypothetical protein